MSGLRTTRSAAVLVVVALCVTSLIPTLASAPGAAQQGGAGGTNGSDDGERAIVVQQGERCFSLDAFGNGSRSVEAFYDYRSPETDPPGWYSSYGNRTQELMAADTSQVFLYRGSDGLSLVFLHDGVASANTTGSGGTVAMNITGLPAEGNWSVQDDDYAEQDDVFEFGSTSAAIEWVWNEGNRSDGGAYTGLGGNDWEEITIEPRFNEASPRYPFEKWNGPPESNRIDSWVARSANDSTSNATVANGSGTNATGTDANASTNTTGGANGTGTTNATLGTNGTTYELNMSEPITITRGPCDAEPPTATLSADRTDLTPGAQVTLDAGGSADNDTIAEYRWDVDGDGTTDATTNESALTTTYEQTGDYDARVTVVDRANNTANATVSIQVQAETTTSTTTTTTSTTTATDSTESDTGTTAADGGGAATGSETGSESGAETASGSSGTANGDGGVLGALPADVSGIDGPSLLGLVVLTLALCVLAVVVLRR